MQYRRAIQLYYRKFHAYPPNIDALVKTNEIRFLRKRYADPITGKDDWKPVLFGQNKVPAALGFFGQPLAGNPSTIAGTGPSGGNNPGGTPFGSSNSGFSLNSSDTGSGTPTAPSTPGAPGAPGGAGAAGAPGSSSSSGQSSQTFGGVGIIGFSPGSSNQSILVYKTKNHFNEWEFTYDPISDMQKITGGSNGLGNPADTNPNGSGGTGLGGSGTVPGTGPNPGAGSNSGSNSNPGSGSTPSPATPQ